MSFSWKRHKALGPLIVFLAISVAFILGYDFGSPPQALAPSDIPNASRNQTVSIMFDFGDGIIRTWRGIARENQQSSTVWSITKQTVDANNISIEYKEYDNLGVFITAIGGKKNDGVKNAWQYWVNNEYATAGVSQYQLTGGEVIMWKYVKGQL